MKIEAHDSASRKRSLKLVRRDDFTDIDGEVITADEDSGECCLKVSVAGETKDEMKSFGPKGFRIVRRAR